MVEMVLILPLVLFMVSAAFTGWDAMQETIRLTSAARAGAIKAANDIQAGQSANALNDATVAVNQEENVNNVFQNTNPAATGYVKMVTATDNLNGSGASINVVTITISNVHVTAMPFVWNMTLTTSATARSS